MFRLSSYYSFDAANHYLKSNFDFENKTFKYLLFILEYMYFEIMHYFSTDVNF